LILTQGLTALQAFLLGILTITGLIQIWQILVLSLIWGTITAFTIPTRHSFTFDLVGKKDLSNALALNTSISHISRILGPGIAGFMVGYFSEGPCFLINSILVMMLVFVLFKINVKSTHREEKHLPILQSLKSGLNYAWKNSFLRYPLLLLLMVSLVVMPTMVLMPIVVKKIFQGDAQTLGILLSCFGAGSLVGSLFLAARKEKKGLTLTIAIAGLIYGLSLTAFALSKNLFLSCFLLALAGAGMSYQAVGINITLQTFTANNMRGRIMSLYMITFVGLAPFGSIILGKLADVVGIASTMLICGILITLSATWFFSKISLIKISAYRIFIKERKASRSEGIEPIL